jgi:hypothetical protein
LGVDVVSAEDVAHLLEEEAAAAVEYRFQYHCCHYYR